MKPFQTRSHLLQNCQLLISAMTPQIADLLLHLGIEGPSIQYQNAGSASSRMFKIILTGFDPSVVDLVSDQTKPVSLVILDIHNYPSPSTDHLIVDLLAADTDLQLVLLTAQDIAPSRLLLQSMRWTHRVSTVHMPRDSDEFENLAHLIVKKCSGEKASEGSDLTTTGKKTAQDEPPLSRVDLPIPDRKLSSPRPATVLIAEDDETVRWMMSQVLSTHHFRVLTAKNAEEAWEHWQKNINTINVIVTDINMPGGPNGVALGHAIQDEDGSVPVIYTSGNRAAQDFGELRTGSNYLMKPFRMDALLEIVQRALAIQLNHGLRPASTRLISFEECASLSK